MFTFLKRAATRGLPLLVGAAALLGGCVAYPDSYRASYGHVYTPEGPIYSYPAYPYYSEPYERGRHYGGRGYEEHEEHEEREREHRYRRFHDEDDRDGREGRR